MPTADAIPFDNSYQLLPEHFYTRMAPTAVAEPGWIRRNSALAAELGIDTVWLASDESLNTWAGNFVPPGAEPIATVYAGHQFGGWNPQLGDGRAILLGEVVAQNGVRYDLQLKGSGQTPYSRMGDGRSPLGPVLREYIVSEAMAALGIPTTRSLAAVTTGEQVVREVGFLPGAILTRVAQSHIRIGTFQFFSARQDQEAVKQLADHVIERHYPEVRNADNVYLALLEGVIGRQARLVAQWQQIGFIHGVMNTDNMLVSGETIDYGPCAFMDDFHPETVYSSIDHHGRYAYCNQPAIAQWNLAWLAQALMPFIADDQQQALTLAQEAINGFIEQFDQAHLAGMLNKLGLRSPTPENQTLVNELLELMVTHKLDFTLTFRQLALSAAGETESMSVEAAAIGPVPEVLGDWLQAWQNQRRQASATVSGAALLGINPVYIPRNHQIEAAIQAATLERDFQHFHTLVNVLAKPYEFDAAQAELVKPPRPEQVVRQTFCGT